MPDVIEQTTNGKSITTKWWSNYLTPQTMIYIIAGFVSLVIFWKDSKDNWAKIGTKADESEIVSLKEQVNDLQRQVNSQYSVQRQREDKTDDEIEQVADWMHEEKGYEKAIDDFKLKK